MLPLPILVQATAPKEAVVYEVNVRAFGPRANFAAVTERLDEIRALGTDVLWLMPVTPTGKLRSAGGLGSPYAVADFDKVNPEFGTEADFRRLISEAHKRKMRVILDWVANHTSWDNPWITRKEWYTRDAKGEITHPAGTNWQDVADLDFANREMRTAMIRSMRGWVTRFGIDGFRCDTADWVPADFWVQAIKSLRSASKRPLLMLAEGGRADHYASGFDLTYGWPFSYRMREAFEGKSAREVVRALQKEDRDAPPGKAALRFSTNHDWTAWEGSPIEMYKSPAGVRTAFSLAAFAGGAALVYTGQEVAWPERIPIFYQSSVDWKRDPETERWMADVLRLRRTHPALRADVTADHSTEDVVAFHRTAGGEESLVMGNVRGAAASVAVPSKLHGEWRDAFTFGSVRVEASVGLRPYGHRVLLRKVRRVGAGTASLQ